MNLIAILWLLLCLLVATVWWALRGVRRLRLQQPKTKKKVIELVWANWIGRKMWNRGWGGLTTWLPGVVVISYWAYDPEPLVRVHEFVHVRQGDDMGNWLNAITHYEAESISDGLAGRGWYSDNKYEQEAYAVEAEAAKNGLPDWAKTQS
jgi:hypothetical protein